MAGENKKILIIVYYWPPSGGSGVQRWVKLSKYLVEQGLEVHVLTVDEKYASYMQLDPSLLEEVHPEVHVEKTRSFEIINVFARIFGKKKVPTAGFYNLDKKSIVHTLGLLIRSNFFIPDPRRGWNRFAFKKACEIIKKEGITIVITSSPPHSSQLIGYRLKKKLGVEWVADLRDPWTDIFYYPLLRHSFLSRKIDSHYEYLVLKNSDAIFTVSNKLKSVFASKSPQIDPSKIFILPNGYDPGDFENVSRLTTGEDFIIGYTGTMSEQYEPWGFLRAFKTFHSQCEGKVHLEITGTISPSIRSFLTEIGIQDAVTVNPSVPHSEIPALLANKSALLLVIPKVADAELILTGKLFEYLASGRPIILIGPLDGDAAGIVKECESGTSFDWNDEEAITHHLQDLKIKNSNVEAVNLENTRINKYSRKNQAKQIKEILFSGPGAASL
jgi:glycosyltransferase involved in cell wall biosynthesis